MAEGPRPIDPDTPEGVEKLQDLVVEKLRGEARRKRDISKIKRVVEWTSQLDSRQHGKFTVADMGKQLDNANMLFTKCFKHRRAESDVDKYIKEVLEALVTPSYEDGVHYHGPIEMTQSGSPKECAANNDLKITKHGAFVLFGSLVPSKLRVSFLKLTWTVMETMAEAYQQLKRIVDKYDAELAAASSFRCQAMTELNLLLGEALNLHPAQANCYVIQKHRGMYALFFRGLKATPAMQYMKLIRPGEQVGTVHRRFSPHGQRMDDARISSLTESVRNMLPSIKAARNFEEKKALVRRALDRVHEHFQEHNLFDQPWCTKKQQIQMYLQERPRKEKPCKRRRLAQ